MLSREINSDMDLLQDWTRRDNRFTMIHEHASLDRSFEYAIKVLLIDRLPKGKQVHMYGSGQHYIDLEMIKDCRKDIIANVDSESFAGGIQIIMSDERLIDKDVYEKITPEEYEEEQVDIETKLREFINCRIFVSTKYKYTIIITPKLNLDLYHCLVAMLRRYLPWLFEGKPLTDTEKKLLACFAMHGKPGYTFSIAKENLETEKKEIIREWKTDLILTDFQSSLYTTMIGKINDQISNVESNIASMYQSIASMQVQKRDLMFQLNGAKASKRGDNNEILDYFKTNTDLRLIDVSQRNGAISFFVNTYFTEFDPDIFETMLDDEYSELYESCSSYDLKDGFDDWNVRHDIFKLILDGTYKIRLQSKFILKINSNKVEAFGMYDSEIEPNTIPNPHLQYYQCLGGNETYIMKALSNNDITGAIMHCQVAAASINVAESPTMSHFNRDLFNKYVNEKVFEDDDGCIYNVYEVMQREGISFR